MGRRTQKKWPKKLILRNTCVFVFLTSFNQAMAILEAFMKWNKTTCHSSLWRMWNLSTIFQFLWFFANVHALATQNSNEILLINVDSKKRQSILLLITVSHIANFWSCDGKFSINHQEKSFQRVNIFRTLNLKTFDYYSKIQFGILNCALTNISKPYSF